MKKTSRRTLVLSVAIGLLATFAGLGGAWPVGRRNDAVYWREAVEKAEVAGAG